jgi:Ca-activated chloride channel family protein
MRRLIAIGAALAVLAGIVLFSNPGPQVTLQLLSGSENRTLEPLIAEWGARNGVDVQVTYKGSVDISHEIARGKDGAFDAVWPANSMWIQLGDKARVVKDAQSILRSPIVLGLKKPIAEKLGWVGREITVQDIAAATESGAFRLALTSATQSNSGAQAYLGFLYALAGNPDLLTAPMLDDPVLQDKLRHLLSLVDRSSGSSGWLKDALVANPQAFDAMFNYEAVVLEANQALEAAGQPPLYIIYPANGLAMADSPLGFIDHGDPGKARAFADLQAMLLSPETQGRLDAMGRRAGLIAGASALAPIWRRDWGADPDRALPVLPLPAPEVIEKALNLYQTELRKPSLTIWVLDTSGSMDGEPMAKLKTAMGLLLDQKAAATNLLQPSARDVSIIIPFDSVPGTPYVVKGDDPAALSGALAMVNRLQAGGGTDVYAALGQALTLLQPYADDGSLKTYLPAIVVMTDGASDQQNERAFYADLAARSFGHDVPIHAISFGDADTDQLAALTKAGIGRIFDSGGDLASAMRDAKGYN